MLKLIATMVAVNFCFLLHRIVQRRQSLNPDFQFVATLDRAHAAGRAGQDDIAGQQGHVGGNKTDQFRRLKDELAGIRVLPELAVLEKLDREFVRIDHRFHERTERRERVERLAAGPLRLGLLNRTVTNVL